MRAPVAVRVDRHEDAAVARALERSEGCTRDAREVARRFEIEPRGQFVARDETGATVGVASCVAWDEHLAWIGGAIVRSDARGRGVERALLRAAIAHAHERGARVVGHDATEAGRSVYAREGFVALDATVRWSRPTGGPRRTPAEVAPFAVYPISVSELLEVAAYDAERFGASRARYLAALLAEHPGRAFMAYDRRSGSLAGFAFGTEERVGPLVADDARAASWLLHATEAAGAPAVAVALASSALAAASLDAAGYRPDGAARARMTLGGPLPGRPGTIVAIGGRQFG